MDSNNLKWWMFPQWSKKYGKGVDEYIERAFSTEAKGNEIRCPCRSCHLRNWLCRRTVRDHLVSKGLGRLPEEQIEAVNHETIVVDNGLINFNDKIDDLLHDTRNLNFGSFSCFETIVKKHRGKTIWAHTHARTMDKRPIVVFNNLDQPVGPTEEIVKEFTQFLGTLAKDSAFAPLNYVSWKHMPFKTKIWEYVQKKFILENDAKKYVLQSVNEKWRLYKTRVKAKYYKEGETMEERMAKRPDDIPEDEFIELMTFWDSENAKEISRTNKRNREKQNDMHTLGPKSFALLREEMKQNDPNKQEPSEADVYIESRKRRPERKYLTQNEETLDNIEKMKALKTTQNESNQTDPYHDVITKKEHSGRVRMYGLGVTKASFKSKDPTTPYKIPSLFLDSIKQEMEKTIAEKMEKDVAEKVEKLVAEQVEQKLYQFLSKVREANQGKDLDIPDLTTIQEDGSSSHANSIGDHDNEYEGT